MPTVIMPKMGDGMDEGTLLRWLKSPGDAIAKGEPLAEIETDKVTIEIEAEADGTLTEQIASEGESVPVGNPIAMILGEGERPESQDAPAIEAQPVADAAAAAGPPARADAEDVAVGATPLATHADADGAAVDALRQASPADAPTSTNGQTPVQAPGANGQTPAPARAPGERLRASPLVKRLAAEHGIDLQGIAGSGPGGRIVKDDIMPLLGGATVQTALPAAAPAPATTLPPVPAVAEQPAPAPAPVAAPVSPAAGRPAGVPRELSRIRRTTGRRMVESKQLVPHFYVTAEVDMAAAVQFREQVNAQLPDDAAKISFNDLIVKACALALREFPNLNASLEGDHLVEHPNIDVNIAVAIEGGLIAPFIPDTDQKSLGTVARMTKDLVGRARNGGLKPEEYQGGTFTVSNLGMYDVEEFIAIINPPQAAILAVGSIKQLPVVVDGGVALGHRMNITLSADHRVSDGAEVARFLQAVKRYLQNPMLLALS